jgi:hypothetical protein
MWLLGIDAQSMVKKPMQAQVSWQDLVSAFAGDQLQLSSKGFLQATNCCWNRQASWWPQGQSVTPCA